MVIAILLMCVLSLTVLCVIASMLNDVNSRMSDLIKLISLNDAEVSPQELEHIESLHLSDFDARIAKFQEELNTPTYADNDAISYHPGVTNMPHDTVTDTHIRVEPEYAE